MRKLFSVMMLATVGALQFTGCTKKCDDPIATNFEQEGECIFNNLPIITEFTIIGDPLPGDSLTIDFIATDTEGLESWTLNSTLGNGPVETETELIVGVVQEIRDIFHIPASAVPGDSLKIEIILTDDNMEITRDSITIAIIAPLIEHTGQFYHIDGTQKGAYDLLNDMEVALADTNSTKDMVNTDTLGASFTGSWEAGNTTSWVKSNTFNYNEATSTAAEATFNANADGKRITNPANGDIYIGNLHGTDQFVVIRIDNVDPTDNTCACINTGKLTFSYKK